MKSIGNKIKELREKVNLDQVELASLCGWVSAFRVKKYEEGLKPISIEDAIALSSVLGAPPSSFLYENEGGTEHIRYKSISVPVIGNITSDGVNLNDFVVTSEGVHENNKNRSTESYRFYGLRLYSKELEPTFSEYDVLIFDSKSYPITNDIVIVKSFFDDLSVRQFIGHENGKFEINYILKKNQANANNEHEISFVLGVVIGTKALE